MMRALVLTCVLSLTPAVALAQLSVTTLNQTTGIRFNGFDGSGFAPSPAAGQLDSDTWKIIGLAAGDTTYGGTFASGTYAQGTSAGGVSTGGIYAFSAQANNNPALGVQATGSDFTPGFIVLRMQNNTGSVVRQVGITFVVCILNNADRSTTLSFETSPDESTWTALAQSANTPAAGASNATWDCRTLQNAVSGLNLADGAFFYLRIGAADNGGSGSRDELAIDDIGVIMRSANATDAGMDAGADTGAADATSADASADTTVDTTVDTASTDATTTDATTTDATTTDATTTDATTTDTTTDAAPTVDTAPLADTGPGTDVPITSDSRPSGDGTSTGGDGGGGGSSDDGGCCSIGASAPDTIAPVSLLLLLFVLARRRRRRRQR
ncbi:MAG: hypothetical protein KC503_42155 [Myxococcales bacterium]|nr:hypothetical protein [Myxococcales bacterium]